jgi:hypothetical protein
MLTEAEKIGAIKAWAAHKTKHTRKKRGKNSHVYSYMKRETVEGKFYEARHSGSQVPAGVSMDLWYVPGTTRAPP